MPKYGGGGNCTRKCNFLNASYERTYKIQRQAGSGMGRETVAIPIELIEVIENWQKLAPPIVNAIMALIRTV